MSHLIRALVVGAVALVQAGCADRPLRVYEGAERPPAEVAWIRGMKLGEHTIAIGFNEQVRILEVDGENVHSIRQFFGQPGVREIAVLPGKHSLLVQYVHMNLRGNGKIWLVAEAGRSYTVQALRKGYSVLFVAVDDVTKKPVGGIVGSSDEPKVPDGMMPPTAPLEQSTEPASPPAEPASPLPGQ